MENIIVLMVASMWFIGVMGILPCTDTIDATKMSEARRILQGATPASYEFITTYPVARTGKTPHIWIGHFRKTGGGANAGCHFLAAARRSFKNRCPEATEIGQVGYSGEPDNTFIVVEYKVNCFCTTARGRRRRGTDWKDGSEALGIVLDGFTKPECSGDEEPSELAGLPKITCS